MLYVASDIITIKQSITKPCGYSHNETRYKRQNGIGWMDEWMDGWMDRQRDGWREEHILMAYFPYCSWCSKSLTLKRLGVLFFQNVILFSNFIHYNYNIFYTKLVQCNGCLVSIADTDGLVHYAVNWCLSRWNGRDTMDVIFFFISRPGGLTRKKV